MVILDYTAIHYYILKRYDFPYRTQSQRSDSLVANTLSLRRSRSTGQPTDLNGHWLYDAMSFANQFDLKYQYDFGEINWSIVIYYSLSD